MGIRYEKDTILNWINEMGKFLRLLVDKRAGMEDVEVSEFALAEAYPDFFGKDRNYFQEATAAELLAFVASLDSAQVRPLALLMMHDGFLNQDKTTLTQAKFLLEEHMKMTASFSFEDYAHLADMDKQLRQLQ